MSSSRHSRTSPASTELPARKLIATTRQGRANGYHQRLEVEEFNRFGYDDDRPLLGRSAGIQSRVSPIAEELLPADVTARREAAEQNQDADLFENRHEDQLCWP